MPDPGPDAVVFDLDGVLVDSEELWDAVRRSLAAQWALPWPAEATRALQGMSTPEWSAYLVSTVGVPGEPAEVAGSVIDRIAAAYAERLPLLSGAVEAVRRTAAIWPLGLASSSPRRLIDVVLEAADLTDAFAVTVSTEEVEAGKPSPAVYRTAAQRLGVAPERTVAVEDSTNGLRSAAAAGCAVIAVPHAAFPPAEDALALAAVRLDGLDALTPEVIRSAAAARSDPG